MQSIFRYPGGKTRTAVRKWITSFRPSATREYREPFVGGGGIFFAAPPSLSRWVNDRNPHLISVYLALRDRPQEFIARCRSVSPPLPTDGMSEPGPLGGKAVNARLKAEFDRVALNTDEDPAYRYYFVNRTVFGGRVNYDMPSRLYFSKPEGWTITETDLLDRAAERMAGVRITTGDYAPLLEEPGEDVWVYCDPPYAAETAMQSTSKLYQFGFEYDDHRRFAAAVAASPHKVCVSYDDDPDGFIRSLFPASEGFHIASTTWAYCGSTNEEKDRGKELCIMNYDPTSTTVSLFDAVAAPDNLTLSDHSRLSELEAVIGRHQRSFVEAGKALREIRDTRLYRDAHPNFDDYCESRWGMKRAYAHQLAAAAEVVENIRMSAIADILPATESQARQLTRLEDPAQQVVAWQNAVAHAESQNEKVTAAMVKSAVDKLLPEKTPEVFDWRKAMDALWKKVPEDAREVAIDYFTTLVSSEVTCA